MAARKTIRTMYGDYTPTSRELNTIKIARDTALTRWKSREVDTPRLAALRSLAMAEIKRRDAVVREASAIGRAMPSSMAPPRQAARQREATDMSPRARAARGGGPFSMRARELAAAGTAPRAASARQARESLT